MTDPRERSFRIEAVDGILTSSRGTPSTLLASAEKNIITTGTHTNKY